MNTLGGVDRNLLSTLNKLPDNEAVKAELNETKGTVQSIANYAKNASDEIIPRLT
jgi:hypothetical protein